ncbi:FAD-binding oxidoreductase [Streptomyces acidicola]|uniref:FAD-binding oxidoreductase n=1 Tax=Streptomyces acidicola TaxID=2596892 RepID=UPI0038182F7F
MAAALHPWGLSISSGDSGDVGLGGLATTAGIGLMGRAHGLTIDHLVAAEVVTADGAIHTVDTERDPDLFWAVRGAGANVGIVTSMDFSAAPVPVVAHAAIQFLVDRIAPFLRAWARPSSPLPARSARSCVCRAKGSPWPPWSSPATTRRRPSGRSSPSCGSAPSSAGGPRWCPTRPW